MKATAVNAGKRIRLSGRFHKGGYLARITFAVTPVPIVQVLASSLEGSLSKGVWSFVFDLRGSNAAVTGDYATDQH